MLLCSQILTDMQQVQSHYILEHKVDAIYGCYIESECLYLHPFIIAKLARRAGGAVILNHISGLVEI